jgi:ParB-like nuclease domain
MAKAKQTRPTKPGDEDRGPAKSSPRKRKPKHRPRKQLTHYFPGRFAEAVRTAQAMLDATEGRPEGPGKRVALSVDEIKTQTELFQPRSFFMGSYELDLGFVTKLKREIGIRGALDPLLVIKLGHQFICLDGHHRLEAYKRLEWKLPITCDWFSGTIRQAVDETIRRNSILKLPMSQPDKLDAAWKRTVLGWGSKAEIKKLCGVSESLIAKMRRVVRRYHEDSDAGRLFRERLGAGLKIEDVPWGHAHAAYHDFDQKEVNQEDAAAKLAKRIHSSFSDYLSLDPEVTALALIK